ncbi:hypothetical protein ACJX0J_030592, partial [Zea mays]
LCRARGAAVRFRRLPRWKWLWRRRRRPGTVWPPERRPHQPLKELELGNGRDESSVSDPASASTEMVLNKGPSDGNAKKRKASGEGKGKDSPRSAAAGAAKESSGKRCRSADESSGAEDNNPTPKGKATKESATKPLAEAPKDYIHVRARRGEATDNHSLAERVRREKISQRMKLLQDLVLGCNKVVGKAVMLDEIINYVQWVTVESDAVLFRINTLPNLLNQPAMHMPCLLNFCPQAPMGP